MRSYASTGRTAGIHAAAPAACRHPIAVARSLQKSARIFSHVLLFLPKYTGISSPGTSLPDIARKGLGCGLDAVQRRVEQRHVGSAAHQDAEHVTDMAEWSRPPGPTRGDEARVGYGAAVWTAKTELVTAAASTGSSGKS